MERRLATRDLTLPDSTLAGSYSTIVQGDTRTFIVSWNGDVLRLGEGDGEPRRLLPAGRNTFFTLDSPSMFSFERDAQGRGRSFTVRPDAGAPIVAPRIE